MDVDIDSFNSLKGLGSIALVIMLNLILLIGFIIYSLYQMIFNKKCISDSKIESLKNYLLYQSFHATYLEGFM